MRISIVNRYYPPSMASTGDLAHELVHDLQALLPDDEVFVVTTNASYRGGWRGELDIRERIVRTGVIYDGRKQFLRILSGLVEGWKLSRIAFRESDIVISLTNPPLVNWWMGRTAHAKGKPLVEWTLDVYPTALAYAGYLSYRHPVHRFFLAGCRKHPPHFNLFLGEGQRKLVHETFGFQAPYRIMPSGMKKLEAGPVPDWKRGKEGRIFIGYVGNIGEAHSFDAIRSFAMNVPEEDFELVFSLYGVKAELLRKALAGRSNVTWVDSIPDPELPFIDIHLVSLLESWTHISVPSKAVTAISIGRPILFIGRGDADTWAMFNQAGWRLSEQDLGTDALPAMFDRLRGPREIVEKAAAAERIAGELQRQRSKTIEDLAEWIRGHRNGA